MEIKRSGMIAGSIPDLLYKFRIEKPFEKID